MKKIMFSIVFLMASLPLGVFALDYDHWQAGELRSVLTFSIKNVENESLCYSASNDSGLIIPGWRGLELLSDSNITTPISSEMSDAFDVLSEEGSLAIHVITSNHEFLFVVFPSSYSETPKGFLINLADYGPEPPPYCVNCILPTGFNPLAGYNCACNEYFKHHCGEGPCPSTSCNPCLISEPTEDPSRDYAISYCGSVVPDPAYFDDQTPIDEIGLWEYL